MEKAGMEALLVFSKQWKAEMIHYVSNYRMFGANAWCLIPYERDPVLYLSEGGDYQRAVAESWISDIRVVDPLNPFLPIHDCKAINGTIGISGLEIIGIEAYKEVSAVLSDRFVNAYWLIDQAARTKTEWEIELVKRGGELADMGFKAELASVHAGIKEYELAAEVNYELLANGADDNFQMFSAGKELDCMHVPRDNVLNEGDFILAEITPYIGSMNYAAQLCRTAKIGEATRFEKEKYTMLATALEEALQIMKPGLPIKEIAKKQNAIIGAAGYEKYCYPPFMRSRGHNFGMGQYELTEDNEDILTAGMAMVVHPNQFIPGVGYLACGETVYVTDNGVVRVNAMPPRIYEVEVAL